MSEGREQRGLLLMRAGAHAAAVYAAEADGVAEWREPVPLPHAPPAVLGVVNVRGRMRTVIDPAVLLGAGAADAAARRLIVILAGNEQLALAVAEAEEVGPPDELGPADARALPLVRATFRRGGETVYLLDAAHLFAAATQGTERRRRRLKP